MSRILALLLVLSCSSQAQTHSKRKAIEHFAEHLALGGATEVGISQLAGGPQKYWAGISAAAIVGAFKEGTDAHDGRDTKKMAAFHALTIVTGAGIMTAVRH